MLAAIDKLPQFSPGKQNGRLVQVEFTLPVNVVQPTPTAMEKK